jgi:glucose-6-phosphate isomerase
MSARLERISQQRCLDFLLEMEAPSLLSTHDHTLYEFSSGQGLAAARFMGWTDLAAHPGAVLAEAEALYDTVKAGAIKRVILIGEGGSSAASKIIASLFGVAGALTPAGDKTSSEQGKLNGLRFSVLDSVAPATVAAVLADNPPQETLYIIASKSGSTMEVRTLEEVVWSYVSKRLPAQEIGAHFIAITDARSELQQFAKERGYRATLTSPSEVGGRYSALSVFGLLTAVLCGLDVRALLKSAATMQKNCQRVRKDNPALTLACALYANYNQGRDKLALCLHPVMRDFGCWLEQLIAESLGKQGKGLIPYVEPDPSLLRRSTRDVQVVCYGLEGSSYANFKKAQGRINTENPVLDFKLATPRELFCQFVLWEYAVAYLGILFELNPFDQPDVEATKALTRKYLAAGAQTSLVETAQATDDDLLAFFKALKSGDYCSINAFLPDHDLLYRQVLESLRDFMAARLELSCCLEFGPRYLHSSGQLQKGGPANGAYLFITCVPEQDITVPGREWTLGHLLRIQGQSDYQTLRERGRRVLYLQLPSDGTEALLALSERLRSAVMAAAA